MKQHIHVCDVNGKQSICFDTGLDPRSFARTKMSQSLIEPGYIVHRDGTREIWKAAGVNEVDGFMRVWGTPLIGERLDQLINNVDSSLQTDAQQQAQQTALHAIVYWIRAKLLLGDTYTTLDPGAVIIHREKGSVFFCPVNLSTRCLLVEGKELNRFSCPDLIGMEAAAFCAAVMLYKILANTFPYQSDPTIFQDMREGVFTPPNLAISGLDKKLCSLINLALLLPVEKRKSRIEGRELSGTEIINRLLHALTETEGEDGVVLVSSLFDKLPQEDQKKLEKEKISYQKKQKMYTKTKRFVIQNKYPVIGITAGILFILFVVFSTVGSSNRRPTTAGLASDQVISAYFNAFSSLDHEVMEACIQGADKSDINVALNLYAIMKTRQAYEMSARATIVPAKVWRDSGGELPAPNAFGVTDMTIEHLAGHEDSGMVMYKTDYILWSPEGYSVTRSDVITLKRDRKKSWRITEILRSEF